MRPHALQNHVARISQREHGLAAYTRVFKSLVVALAITAPMMSADVRASDELPAWMTERRIIGSNKLEKIQSVAGTPVWNFTRPIARVENDAGEGFCTGWRVADDLFMTNYHCWEFEGCNVQFRQFYQDDTEEGTQRVFKCEESIHQNLALDYALYRVKLAPSEDGSTPTDDRQVITLSTRGLRDGQRVVVAGHPRARTMEIDRSEDCKILSAEVQEIEQRQTISHLCDTEGGSSGSPVMDRTSGHALALHWGGQMENNFAIPMNLIVTDLRANIDAADFARLRVAP
jgi:V8-like Glu-specific endopeptidase